MPKWAKILATSSALFACAFCMCISSNLIQLATCSQENKPAEHDLDLYISLTGKTIDEVESILEAVEDKRFTLIKHLSVEYLLELRNPSRNPKLLCKPADVKRLVEILSSDNNKCIESLQKYVDYYFRKLIPVCVDNIDKVFKTETDQLLHQGMNSWKRGSLLIKFNHLPTSEKDIFDSLSLSESTGRSELIKSCKFVIGLKDFIDHMNFYDKETVSVVEKERLLRQWPGALKRCKKYLETLFGKPSAGRYPSKKTKMISKIFHFRRAN